MYKLSKQTLSRTRLTSYSLARICIFINDNWIPIRTRQFINVPNIYGVRALHFALRVRSIFINYTISSHHQLCYTRINQINRSYTNFRSFVAKLSSFHRFSALLYVYLLLIKLITYTYFARNSQANFTYLCKLLCRKLWSKIFYT